VLTHTNAGVDVLRRRLRSFGLANSVVRVDTIASWSWNLIRHYPRLSGVVVTGEPEWRKSKEFYIGATCAVGSQAIRAVMRASYGLAIVDEYQDCIVEQHDLVVALAQILPVCVFGDRLQSIFGFGGDTIVTWDTDVLHTWPAFPVLTRPWRWEGHNEPLGQWLLDIRPQLAARQTVDLAHGPLTWRSSKDDPQQVIKACYGLARAGGSVVAIGQFENDCAYVAARTGGHYGMMEELEGKFMLVFARIIDDGEPRAVAVGTRNFAVSCMNGIAAKLNKPVADKLTNGEVIVNLKRPGAERQLELLSGLLDDPSPGRVAEALDVIAQMPGGQLYRREAWRDMQRALTVAAESRDVTVTEALSRIRSRTRFGGRRTEGRVISRPLLIKGLEYDHALVLNAQRLSSTELYVALSRGRKSLTVVSDSRYLRPGHRKI
jgi:hypothetical protein